MLDSIWSTPQWARETERDLTRVEMGGRVHMARRETGTPPAIDGFTPIKLIGVGGYADVFLYQQHRPLREVAIKVLGADAVGNEQQRRQFTAEADLMARVSTHPYIVPVFQADIAADGRPYIVMEFYPGSNFLERVRREQFSVAEVLRTGIHIASAVETAHRAGILHRDLKPANILTSEFGRAGLTDFGIAAPEEQVTDEAEGLSIPWAPPEAFGSARLDERADVYSLAATVYHLLARRSPFETPGAPTSPLELMNRIERMPLPPTGRADAPASLERLLAQAMAKSRDHRPASAADFGRLLQGVEAEMHLAVTQLELAGERAATRLIEEPGEIDDSTRIRGVVSIAPERPSTLSASAAPSITGIPSSPSGIAPVAPRQREGMIGEPNVDATIHRPTTAGGGSAASSGATADAKRPPWALIGIGAVVAIVAAVIALASLGGSDDAVTRDDADDEELVNDGELGGTVVIAIAPDVVRDLVGVANGDGTFGFTWSAPDGAAGEITYQVTERATAEREQTPNPPQPEMTFTAVVPCVEVIAIVTNLASSPTPACAG